MNILQNIRNRQKRAALRTCGVFITVWVNLVFQTCAMAAMPAGDCPHCPPGMHDSGMPMAPMDCGLIDSIDDPDLVGPADRLDSGIDGIQPVAFAGLLPVDVRPTQDVKIRRHKALNSVHGPPLNVLFCVYLK